MRRSPASHCCQDRKPDRTARAASDWVIPAALRASATCSGVGLEKGPVGPRLGCDAMSVDAGKVNCLVCRAELFKCFGLYGVDVRHVGHMQAHLYQRRAVAGESLVGGCVHGASAVGLDGGLDGAHDLPQHRNGKLVGDFEHCRDLVLVLLEAFGIAELLAGCNGVMADADLLADVRHQLLGFFLGHGLRDTAQVYVGNGLAHLDLLAPVSRGAAVSEFAGMGELYANNERNAIHNKNCGIFADTEGAARLLALMGAE